MDKEFQRVLDICLERLRQGEGPEQCLAAYPQFARELEPLLRLAYQLRKATQVQARPEFKAAARHRLLVALRTREERKRQPVLAWSRRWAVALASLLVVLLGGSTVVAANNSQPDENLYPVKLAVEEVRLRLPLSAAGRARLQAEFAGRRSQEIAEMGSNNKPQAMEKASQRLAQHLERVASQASGTEFIPAPEWLEVEATLERNAVRHREVLERALERAPLSARPALRRALEDSDARYQQAIQGLRQGPPGRIKGEPSPLPRPKRP